MKANDSFISSELFNTLIDVHDQPPIEKSDLLELGTIFQKYGVVDKYMLGLLHKHYDLTDGKIAVTTDVSPDVTITKATAVNAVAHRSLRGQLYFLHSDEWQAYEYEDGPTEEFDPNFLSELADKIRALDLEERVSLGSSKKSLGTREMLIAPDATASFTSSSLGNSWPSLDVKILEVGWGFIESTNEPGVMVLESYTGHGTSTTTGNHVAPVAARTPPKVSSRRPISKIHLTSWRCLRNTDGLESNQLPLNQRFTEEIGFVVLYM